MRFLSLLFFVLLALVCIWLAVANRVHVPVSLAPLDIGRDDVPLFYVFLFGTLIGILAIGPGAAVRQFNLKRRLNKAQSKMRKLEGDLDVLTAERDDLARRVRPQDDRYAEAQEIEIIAATPMLPGDKA